jgi:dTDP-4-dehydrorhamnose 3,5-epimerase
MNVLATDLPEVLLVEVDIFADDRGFLFEAWHRQKYGDRGIAVSFVQDNVSFSHRGVLRGLHFQEPRPQAKLVSALGGEIFDVAVDIRVGSPRFGRWTAAVLSAENHRQLFIPEGFVHGFCVLSEWALVHYKCSEVYVPSMASAIAWNDPTFGIDWPITLPTLSPADAAAPPLEKLARERLPRFLGDRDR